MKINILEISKDKEFDLEIILVDNLKKIKSKEDKELLEKLDFKAKDESVVLLAEKRKIYVGFEDYSYDSLAIAISGAIKKFNSTKFKSAKLLLNKELEDNFKALVEGSILGSYSFNHYKSEKDDKKQELYFVVEKKCENLSDILKESQIIANAVNKARDMVNTAPADFTPKSFVKEAEIIAKEFELEYEVLGEKDLEKQKMMSMHSVGRASVHESQLIHLKYRPKKAKRKIVLVGKGLTYDSGGLSLKPADFMVTMKADKSGAVAVLNTIKVIAELKLNIEVHAIIGAVENMIGGNAYKPDDILRAKNGKTIEVRNTDAEGRLVLADCLCYAQDEIKDFDYIFDFATLTGACVVGLGEYTTGIMGNSEELKQKALEASLNSGEYATKLDFNRYLKKCIKSEIADVCNISNTRYGGAITAGMFLDNFIYEENKNRWVHFDIAGPAFVEKAWGYNPYGASGTGVRMAVEFIKNLAK
ncbi:leucyl aminopeptidase [Aliarcobacter skirrowii]|uniref:Probable cytosol aminopeptidase n=1 Tax=Aliarcobacter skirrowii CCUG 10374 TaxID=1032239 RepID=A0AAD0WNP6_9BACT|nr:leucyl aminopeptidase [Aliarcobacter skirrowii]AXX85152.1 leucyl aminopeptidase, peptidase M17 family [Aliarcobacter skirrowii CCUG 10374]KAB0620691.1 leucyl aminopeptidase [Aliarcobacter skirrowii CCUG 10374]MCT7446927.1 leucyl aminopeptidase [Aliarcobacter skirrowii]MDX3960234.1 leucyl aminopeptidase [Aliarcobacter skirrowii]MDX4012517.1 leucyl aminopeptidase [Aliarcobacter skirrowii]